MEEKTNETVLQVRKEILRKINEAEDEGKKRVEGLQQETTERFKQFKHEVHQVQKEAKEEIGQVQTRVEERCNQLDVAVNEVKGKTTAHEGKIEESRLRELRLQEEVNALKDRPYLSSHIPCNENRDIINFRSYKRNPDVYKRQRLY